MSKFLDWARKEIVLVVAWILAVATTFIVPVDKDYLGYIHWDTLALLLILMLVMAGFKSLGVLTWLGEKLLERVSNKRSLELILVLCCFFAGMIVTNDVSLITFVPFAIITLKMADMRDRIVTVVALQSIAANLGAMLTPIGNPHNIYFFFLSGASVVEFMKYTTPFCLFGLVLLIASSFFVKKEEVGYVKHDDNEFEPSKLLALYIILFAIGLFSLTKLVSVPLLCGIVVVAILIFDRDVFSKVDYSLLFTFLGFFIFVGNMQRIELVQDVLTSILQGREMLVTVGLCQFISNLPTALLLSGFTEKWQILMVGTDIGGLGTLIASMANLISYKAINAEDHDIKKGYVGKFSLFCIVFLAFELALYYVVFNF